MSRKPYPNSQAWDKTVWIGKFTGYRMLAFGREQILRADIEIHVRQEFANPAVWVARAYPGAHAACASAATPNVAMSVAAGQFVTVLTPWRAFTAAELCTPRTLLQAVASAEEKAGG